MASLADADRRRAPGAVPLRATSCSAHTCGQSTTVRGGTYSRDVVALTHLWWTGEGPADDPYAPDRDELRRQRERVLETATLVVPGHGPAFRPGAGTPR